MLEAAERCLAEALERGAGPALAGAAALDWAPAKPQGSKGQHSEFMLDLIAQFKARPGLACVRGEGKLEERLRGGKSVSVGPAPAPPRCARV